MLLEKPAFSVILPLEGAERKVSSLLKKKNWHKFKFPNPVHAESEKHGHGSIFYFPYWFFSYDAHEDGKKTSLLAKGSGALNAFSNELDGQIGTLTTTEGLEKSNELPDERNITVIDCRVDEEEAKKVIPVLIAAQSNAQKANVIISGLEMFYVPVWLVQVHAEEHQFSLRVNAVDGTIINGDDIPSREKEKGELAKELLDELSSPAGWIHYTSQVISAISAAIFAAIKSAGEGHKEEGRKGEGRGESHENAKPAIDEDLLVVALAVLAILALLWAAFP
ncbi:MAG TPA: hypothetical protein HA254_00855 [Candidatus Diapherotrites archaeon]|uniref:Uncharacterized protein n=1 Tax=Candidatus Iainarchaeum sp. TaxID=3101447 RepID=A0A7J4IUJ1_9ARCH|nr:hypothetical protein [Candidatus Diapherotrites archaeon]